MRNIKNLLLWSIFAGGLVACGESEPDPVDSDDPGPPPPPLEQGVPVAGAAEGVLKLPIGTPLSGFTSRCTCLGSTSRQDRRDSAFTDRFVASTGFHIRPTIKAIWLTNGDRHLVLTKTDTIYSFDRLVGDLTARLEDATGESLQGMVVHTANHNHSSYGTFSQHTGLFLGHDKFHQDNYELMLSQLTDVAVQAYEARREAAIGMGIAKDWDPDNRVYSDRRSENRELVVFDDMGPEQGGKDPHMHLLRVDEAASGEPIAVMFAWGMHPYVFGADNPLATADATALIEAEVSESFDRPVVSMFVQTSGGDASVRGSDTGWARMETVGLLARDAVLELRESTPTSSEPIWMETMSRAVEMKHGDIRVTRGGEVDWYYGESFPPDEEPPVDNIVFDENGDIVSPLDEFTAAEGAVFCGSGFGDLPVGKLAPNIDGPYRRCVRVSFMANVLKSFFNLEDSQVETPIQGMGRTYMAASKFGPIPVRQADGTEVEQEVLWGFFPGEVMHFFSEMWRRRVSKELGIENAVAFGYSMDHEGYLTIPEDWLVGGYESDITFLGPLAGEWVMENALQMSDEVLLTDVGEFFDPARGPAVYEDLITQEPVVPDLTPNAGTRLLESDLPEYFWIPEEFTLDLSVSETLARVQGVVQLAWEGGDPAVDNPGLTLERQTEGGDWESVRSHTGRIINEDHHDFGVGHTPDPLFPAEAQQRHYYWGVWQAVGHIRHRAGLPEGTYRLRVDGHRYGGQAGDFPWDAEPYTFTTDPFEIVPAPVTVQVEGEMLRAWIQAPENGFRLVDLRGFSRGRNPLSGPVTVTWTVEAEEGEETLAPQVIEDPEVFDALGQRNRDGGGWTLLSLPEGEQVVSAVVEDVYGNTGTWSAQR